MDAGTSGEYSTPTPLSLPGPYPRGARLYFSPVFFTQPSADVLYPCHHVSDASFSYTSLTRATGRKSSPRTYINLNKPTFIEGVGLPGNIGSQELWGALGGRVEGGGGGGGGGGWMEVAVGSADTWQHRNAQCPECRRRPRPLLDSSNSPPAALSTSSERSASYRHLLSSIGFTSQFSKKRVKHISRQVFILYRFL
ncbi:hypothetical protein L226DRAFT_58122 [Lentinus tigrinus ALCF2SS1-7]|uniref:Uncharacterized protein n=1 Tax=Lentinus tigrinus ALCF2SS1-6 TaxID=1328759 RepID=A0A5C2SIC1_9APHY|nr:hypothetical protein L227DRAFT_77824 [Lentinus tigrinus ALCF2SS1-6]RPD75226.1 hypothetical protein L226DRAFT_58122 [Lentinus tigrinus ALCF2SS1-7]